jgi:CDP-glycerol glycerophosphotransferase (TagB/SpsB family)
MSKKVIITIVDGLHLRYLIDTGVIARLAAEHVRMLLLTIPSLQSRLEREAAKYVDLASVALLEEVPITQARRIYLSLNSGTNKKLSETVNFKTEVAKQQEPMKYFLLSVLKKFSATFPYQKLMAWTASSFASSYYRKLLESFSPDLVVFSTPGQKLHDVPLLYECIRAKVPTISPVYSWDNLTAKGPFIFRVDKLIVWNEIMRREAKEFHAYKDDQIIVTGVPVFDPYLSILDEGEQKKSEFKSELGIKGDKPLITVTTIPQIFFGSSHKLVVMRLQELMRENKIPDSCILIRPHPKDATDYSDLASPGRIIIDTYGTSPDETLKNWVPKDDNIIHLGRTMRYSDIVVNISSTITIDAACFDTPVINLCYDVKENESDYAGSVERYYLYTHYRYVVESGASTLVKSEQELIDAINAYLSSPKLHSKERNDLVRQQTGVIDGRAHERVAQAILDNLN